MPDFAKRFRKEVTEQIGATSGKSNNGFAEYSLNLEGGNMKAVICPVCDGLGEVDDFTMDGRELTTIHKRLCFGCNGKGWVEVSNADDRLTPIPNFTFTNYADKNRCPACGGDRNAPALTGCPMGSHYGSYCEG